MLEILTFILLIFVGFIMGLIGAGSGILLVPIFIFFQNFSFIQASTYALLIGAFTACFGAFSNYKQINYKKGFEFLVFSSISIFLTRKYLLNYLPETILNISKDQYLLFFFSFILLLSAILMFEKSHIHLKKNLKKSNTIFIILSILTGIISGLTGATGGFLIIPILTILVGLNMHNAIQTSLFIITINSFIGVFANSQSINFSQNLLFIIISIFLTILGILIGEKYQHKVNSKTLSKYFGIGLILLSIIIFITNFFQ